MSSETAAVFSGKKYPIGNKENEVSVTIYTPQHCMIKWSSAIFHCNSPFFLLPRKFLQTFSVEFNFY